MDINPALPSRVGAAISGQANPLYAYLFDPLTGRRREVAMRRRTSNGPPNTLAQRLIAQRFGVNPAAGIQSGQTAPAGQASPTIRGWQNYTGKTMGEVGQYSRIPGFGRAFRG